MYEPNVRRNQSAPVQLNLQDLIGFNVAMCEREMNVSFVNIFQQLLLVNFFLTESYPNKIIQLQSCKNTVDSIFFNCIELIWEN